MDPYRILDIVISISMPLLILVLGWVYVQHQNNTDDHKKLKDKIKSMADNDVHEQLDSLEKMVEKTTNQIEALSDKVDALTDSQRRISSVNRLNGRYTHELAQLVMTLSEGIRDQHLDGNITKAIARYRKFEEHTLGAVVVGEDAIPSTTNDNDK